MVQLILFALLFALLLAGGLAAYSLLWTRRVEKLCPPRGDFTDISSGRLHYIDCGEGPEIVLIHALGGNLGHFDLGMIDDLARDHRVIAIDRPGSGWSDRPSGACATPRAQARLMLEALDRLGVSNPLLVGHSLGGTIALAMALEAPERIRGLALLAPLTLVPDRVNPALEILDMGSDLMRRLKAWTVAVPRGMRNTRPVAEFVFGPEEIPPAYPQRGGGLLWLRPNQIIESSRDYAASHEELPEIARACAAMTVPVRILFGRDDRMLDPQRHGQTFVARCPQMGLRLVPGGHMLPVTQPVLCAEFARAASQKMAGGLTIRRASPEVYR